MLQRFLLVIGCIVFSVCLTGCPPTEPTDAGDSVRIGTFNVQFLPGSDDDTTRSKRIADRIKAGQYDIIALNEVFDEEARETFVSELAGTYPSYVAYLGDPTIGVEDSGLMLFSRFPFEPLPVATYRYDPDYVTASNAGVDWNDVAFTIYEDDVFPDNWAGKGVAFVRIRNPRTNRIINVAFTHTQASYPEDEDNWEEWLEPIDARAAQFGDIQRIIQGSLTPGQAAREAIFVMGDLNVDGDLSDPNLGGGGWGQPNLWEWTVLFNTPGHFFTDTIIDGWAFEQSPDDRGLSNLYNWGPPFSPDQGSRLDYILRNRPTGGQGLVIQHLTMAHNMRDGTPYIESGFGQAGINELSDHIGINADLNQWAPNCNPTDPILPVMDVYTPGIITYPGSMQWFRVDSPGTYAFDVAGTGMDFRVYASTDMSTPVAQYFDETTTFIGHDGKPITAKKYALQEAPFYIRAFKTDRTATGTYNFIAHRNQCASADDAEVLWANNPVAHFLPATPLNADDTAWFELYVEMADSGVPQDVRFFVDQFAGDKFQLELRREDEVTSVEAVTTPEADPDNPGGNRLVIEPDGLGTIREKLYLLVKRTDLTASSFRVGWETNLTILHGQGAGVPGAGSENIYCVEETDTIGIDEVYLTVVVDGIPKLNDVYIGEYDNGVYRTMEDLIGTVRYLSNVAVTLREEDGGFNGDDDFLSTTVLPLAPDKLQDLNITSVLDSSGGRYLFRYNLSRSLHH